MIDIRGTKPGQLSSVAAAKSNVTVSACVQVWLLGLCQSTDEGVLWGWGRGGWGVLHRRVFCPVRGA